MAEIVLTDEQQAVVTAALAFIDDPCPARPWWYFEGLAGVGKSCVLAEIGRRRRQTVPVAYTGKAASVLARKSGLEVLTMHQLIYRFVGENDEGRPCFRRAHKDGALRRACALADEISMLGTYIMGDFFATGCRIIGCGDPGQLQPVRDTGFFKQHKPDAVLTQIHRQAWDSAIIRQAHAIRHTGQYAADGDDFQVVRGFSAAQALEAGVLICWRNATRHVLNRLSRQWRGLPDGVARRGEPVMCLKNNHDLGILNGAVYELLEDHAQGGGVILIKNERNEAIEVEAAWIEDFEAMPYAAEVRPFAFGYAITGHKSQASQWPRVIVIDEYNKSDERREWLYTVCTRASEKVLVQRNW